MEKREGRGRGEEGGDSERQGEDMKTDTTRDREGRSRESEGN